TDPTRATGLPSTSRPSERRPERSSSPCSRQIRNCARSPMATRSTSPAVRDLLLSSLRKGRGLVDAPGRWLLGRRRNTPPCPLYLPRSRLYVGYGSSWISYAYGS